MSAIFVAFYVLLCTRTRTEIGILMRLFPHNVTVIRTFDHMWLCLNELLAVSLLNIYLPMSLCATLL